MIKVCFQTASNGATGRLNKQNNRKPQEETPQQTASNGAAGWAGGI
ncbi:hypothetical protein [Neisseria sp. 74A18]|nr:hypothetical protein [Neisseria sp. 74A18]